MLASHLLRPLMIFLLAAMWLEFSGVDLWLADVIYHWSGDSWRWRDAWVTATLVHEYGRSFVAVLVLMLVLLIAASWWVAVLRPFRSGLCYVLVSAIMAGLIVNIGKRLTQVDCPWDLLRYGGTVGYVRNFTSHANTGGVGGCFPAGHASAGYAWFGLYYFVRQYWPRWSRMALLGVLLLGLVFGIAQQLRGAHFLSHDAWTLGICWLVATTLALIWFRPGKDVVAVSRVIAV